MSNPLADELEAAPRARPCVLVIFGASGDLTHRKLVPNLMRLAAEGLLPSAFAVIGFARRDWRHSDFRRTLGEGVERFGDRGARSAFTEWQDRFEVFHGDYDDPESFERLARRLDKLDRETDCQLDRLFYLATPPSAYAPVLDRLSGAGLSRDQDGRRVRVVVEKPFGHDLDSARSLNQQVAAAFAEHQVFRIDHYLGKETVQNILALRFANSIFEPLWNRRYVDHVQITVAESIGIEGRGGYFEHAGIIRDMIQNHLLQVLSMVAMEPPVSSHGDAIRDEKVKVLRAIRTLTTDKVCESTVRGQYTTGYARGEPVQGYREEEGVAADSTTETFAAVKLYVDNWRWGGTPFFLRSGKRLARRVTEVAIHFTRPPHLLYGDIRRSELHQNVLLLRVQPDEGISLRFGSKVPGPEFQVRGVRMDFSYGSAFGGSSADAYQRLLFDVMKGDQTLFARRDEVEEAWRIVDSIAAGWASPQARPPADYEAGTWGPAAADELLGPRRTWRRP